VNPQPPSLIVVRPVISAEIGGLLSSLVVLLQESVNEGASLGFLPPLSADEGERYWRSLAPELDAGTRSLFGVFRANGVIGTGQLSLPSWPNAGHRAEIQKVMVATAARGRGVGRALAEALHAAARERGRSLLVLNTRRGEPPERFYRALGYQEVGVIPGYSAGPAGERYDNLTLFYDLDRPASSAADPSRPSGDGVSASSARGPR
jgi:ribosomal protein S18 acetylase RimI-like enzyme